MIYTYRDASISSCETYRWWLSRGWGTASRTDLPPENPLAAILLNPSTADGYSDDPTIRRLVDYAQRWGHDGLVVCNLFAFRATDPDELYKTAADPVGHQNDDVIRSNCRGRTVLCGWGAHGDYMGRDKRVLEILREIGAKPICLGRTRDGQPRHPLYLRADLTPEAYA